MSRLLIHAGMQPKGGLGSMAFLVRCVGAAVRHATLDSPGASTIEICDLQGHRWLALSHSTSLIDVVLPTGTYHIITQRGQACRSYTVTLEQNTTTDLHVPLERPFRP
jgi:hypothetical protein